MSETFVRRRPLPEDPGRRGRVTVDDAVGVLGRFRNGALASLEATRFAPGRKNGLTIEINGSAGSIVFDLEQMNRLQFYNTGDPDKRRIVERVLTRCAEEDNSVDVRPLLTLLRRFAAEAAREEARVFCQELAADAAEDHLLAA